MRWLVSLLIVVVLAVAVGLAARYAQGYVLFVMPRTRVEMSLTLFVLLTALALVLSYALLRTLLHLWQLPARVQAYRLHRRRNRARSAMHEAMSAYLEGHFERAEKAAAKAMRLQDSPQLGSALAAHAAQARGDAQQSDQYINFGEAEAKQPSRLMQMTRAKVLHGRGAHAQALQVLANVLAAAPKYVPALRLALQAQQSLAQWSEVERIGAQLAQLGHGNDALVRDALQAAARNAHDALTQPGAAAQNEQRAEVVALRPRQGGQQ